MISFNFNKLITLSAVEIITPSLQQKTQQLCYYHYITINITIQHYKTLSIITTSIKNCYLPQQFFNFLPLPQELCTPILSVLTIFIILLIFLDF